MELNLSVENIGEGIKVPERNLNSNTHRVKSLIEETNSRFFEFDLEDEFLNWNTPEIYSNSLLI